MSGDLLLAALLCTALALALSFAPAKSLVPSYALFVFTAFAAAALVQDFGEAPVRVAIAAAVLVMALAIFAPGGVRAWLAILLSTAAGFGCGVLASLAPTQAPLATLPLALLGVAGQWIVRHQYALILKILAGWLVAVAVLAGALPLVTTPGYEPDHME